jgi:hypothetical protein
MFALVCNFSNRAPAVGNIKRSLDLARHDKGAEIVSAVAGVGGPGIILFR